MDIRKRIHLKILKKKKDIVIQMILRLPISFYRRRIEKNILWKKKKKKKRKNNTCGNYDNNSERKNPNYQKNNEVNNSSDCALSNDEYSTLETESDDKQFNFSDYSNNYYKCENDYCWYDANIINYSMTNYPCSMHKIEWKNKYGVIENKWISLYDYDIEVPVEPHSVLIRNESGDNTLFRSVIFNDLGEKSYNNPYYFMKTSIEPGNSTSEESKENSCTQPLENNNVDNAYLHKNYFGNISCSTNKDCSRYGSLYCDGGYCSTKYIQL